ncbi:MAG: hypothetical protein IJ237_01780 [Oscillospiraceae bacterium]|nr:hypothetical protein [Oscillospiraceae bacterium]
MKKAIIAYLIGKEIVGFIVLAAMMIGLLAACLVAYIFTPESTVETDDSYTYTFAADNHHLHGFTPNSEYLLTVPTQA